MDERTRTILELIKEQRQFVLRRYMDASKDHQGQKAYIARYDSDAANNGPGPDFRRPTLGAEQQREETAKKDLAYIDRVYDHAVEVFIGEV